MKNNTLHFIKYAGSKRRFISTINEKINQIEDEVNTYVEPFLGSGAVLLNLNKQYTTTIAADIDDNLLRIFKSFKEISYSDLLIQYNLYQKQYGNWGRNKEIYYKFRDEQNARLFKTDCTEEGLFYYFISRSCINSLMRFGKNGFNQGFGNRGYDIGIDEISFNKIKDKIKNVDFFCIDFFKLFEDLSLENNKDILWFIDPPYLSTTYFQYNTYDLLKHALYNNKAKFYDILRSIKGKVIYTDMRTKEIEKELQNWNIINLRELISIRPDKTAGTKRGIECMYCNF